MRRAGTYMSLQQEVEVKTKKLKKFYARLQVVNAEIQDQHDEYIYGNRTGQEGAD